MGQNNQWYALVSMTNNDVYYIDEGTARLIMDLIEADKKGFVTFQDAKSGSKITINLDNFSSIVVKGGQNA